MALHTTPYYVQQSIEGSLKVAERQEEYGMQKRAQTENR